MNVAEKIHFSFPKTLRGLLRLQAHPHSRGVIIAGGTDLMAQWAAGAPPPPRAVSLSHVPTLDTIRIDKQKNVLIGTAVTHALIRDCPPLKRLLPALVAASSSVGATQIQARGTLGGNAVNASPAGDTAPALLITNGVALAASLRGTREIPLSAFWLSYRKTALAPDEVLLGFRLPSRGRAIESFRKIGTRRAQAISKIMLASRICLDHGTITTAAIAIGSVAPIAIRLPSVESFLIGRTPSHALAAEAAKRTAASLSPISDIRSSAEYRRWAAARLVLATVENLLPKLAPKPKRKSS